VLELWHGKIISPQGRLHADKAHRHLGATRGKWIAEAHGGTISAASKPGEGSVFQVRIPLAWERRD